MQKNFGWKIKNTNKFTPHIMFGIEDQRGLMEIESSSNNYKENYMLLFKTKEEAQSHIDKMNNYFCINPKDGEKIFWYRNRENKIVEVNTKLRRFKSKYVSIQDAINLIYQ
jgi:hypothetical protein